MFFIFISVEVNLNMHYFQDLVTKGNFIVYPFTAPVIDVQLEDSLLHTLTDTGLETYTMRASQHLMKNSEATVIFQELN